MGKALRSTSVHVSAIVALGLGLAQPTWAQQVVRADTLSSHSQRAISAEVDATQASPELDIADPAPDVDRAPAAFEPPAQDASVLSWRDTGYVTAATVTFLYAVASTRTRILCAGPVVDEFCPRELQVSRTRTRPHLTGGLAVTGLIGLAGYLHHRYADQIDFSTSTTSDAGARGRSVSLGLLTGEAEGTGVAIDLLRISF